MSAYIELRGDNDEDQWLIGLEFEHLDAALVALLELTQHDLFADWAPARRVVHEGRAYVVTITSEEI